MKYVTINQISKALYNYLIDNDFKYYSDFVFSADRNSVEQRVTLHHANISKAESVYLNKSCHYNVQRVAGLNFLPEHKRYSSVRSGNVHNLVQISDEHLFTAWMFRYA